MRLIGFATARGEVALRRPGQGEPAQLVAGAALTLSVVAGTYCFSRKLIQLAADPSPAVGDLLEVLLAWTCLAARNLEQEATSVTDALACDDLPLARQRLARIVGRDTQHLGLPEGCRAVIETLAESASDGILAPLFYMALGGVPLAMAYKAVNTLDSMIGHTDERYFYFGKAAARLDDFANYVPARVTAAAIVAAASFYEHADMPAAWRTWRRDGDKHKSPNAGQPESAMAGALHVQLGGDNTYGGDLVSAAFMGHEFPQASLPKARSATRLVTLVTLLGVSGSVLLAAFVLSLQTSRSDA